MEKLEFHFFHGFLGSPQDWSEVIQHLNPSSVVNHDLNQDFLNPQIDLNSPFYSWASLKEKSIKDSSAKKMLVAYSMGGRLSLHLNLDLFERVLLIGVHPGLQTEQDQRARADQEWAHKLSEMDSKKWLQLWNSQDVFSSDQRRPSREISDSQKPLFQKQLLYWSLSQQNNKDATLKENAAVTYWCCGDRDEKFLPLRPRLKSLLGESHVFTVENSGHGVHFDQPLALAREIQRLTKL